MAVRQGRAPRRVELRKADFDTELGGHGYTGGCPKCEHAVRWGWGRTSQHHSAECVRRVSTELAKTPRGRARLEAAQKRADEWAAKRGPLLLARPREAMTGLGAGPARRLCGDLLARGGLSVGEQLFAALGGPLVGSLLGGL